MKLRAMCVCWRFGEGVVDCFGLVRSDQKAIKLGVLAGSNRLSVAGAFFINVRKLGGATSRSLASAGGAKRDTEKMRPGGAQKRRLNYHSPGASFTSRGDGPLVIR